MEKVDEANATSDNNPITLMIVAFFRQAIDCPPLALAAPCAAEPNVRLRLRWYSRRSPTKGERVHRYAFPSRRGPSPRLCERKNQ
jgi:hypothetical protein